MSIYLEPLGSHETDPFTSQDNPVTEEISNTYLDGLVCPTDPPSLSVNINSMWYPHGSRSRRFSGMTADLEPFWIHRDRYYRLLLYLGGESNRVHVVGHYGTEVAQCPMGGYPLAYVDLDPRVGAITWAKIHDVRLQQPPKHKPPKYEPSTRQRRESRCPYCGMPIENGSRRCDGCGAPNPV